MDASAQPIELDQIRIASPCNASWDSMEGTERARHCGQCKLNVYNISEMSRGEAEELIRETEGRLCVRLFRRHDGTVLTRDCPSRARRFRRGVMASIVLLFGFLGLSTTIFRDDIQARLGPEIMGGMNVTEF